MRLPPPILFLVLLVGCTCTRVHDQADAFRRKHPNLARGYSVLAPVSVEYIEYVRPDEQVYIEGVLAHLEQIKKDPSRIDRYIEYLTCVCEGRQVDRLDWLSVIERMKKTDSIYYFEYETLIGDVEYGDYGLLILRNGDVVYRHPHGQGLRGTTLGSTLEDLEEAEYPPGMTMDKL